MTQDNELEAHIRAVQLDHRRLWLDSADQLGLVAETLADALGWQPSHNQPMPDALRLAEQAAARLREIERQAASVQHRQPRQAQRRQREYA